MTRKVESIAFAGLLVLLAVLLAWRAGWFAGRVDSPAAKRSGKPAVGGAREEAPDWSGLVRLAEAVPKAGTVDLFSGVAQPIRKPRAASRALEPVPAPSLPPAPVPETHPLPPPPPPPEDPLAAVRKDLASYRFMGYLQKTGDMVVFLAVGNNVFLVKKGDVLGRTRTVVVQDIREREILFLFPPDRRIRAVLKDNSPLVVN